jgi:hypothetical protein
MPPSPAVAVEVEARRRRQVGGVVVLNLSLVADSCRMVLITNSFDKKANAYH